MIAAFFAGLLMFIVGALRWGNSWPGGGGWLALAMVGVGVMFVAGMQLEGW